MVCCAMLCEGWRCVDFAKEGSACNVGGRFRWRVKCRWCGRSVCVDLFCWVVIYGVFVVWAVGVISPVEDLLCFLRRFVQLVL